MKFPIEHFKKMDWILIGTIIAISLFGLAGLWSTSFANGDFFNFQKQIIFLSVGFLLMLAISFFDYRIFRNNSYLILIPYFIFIVLLIGLHFFAPVIRGARNWYKIGFFTLDPSEPIKIFLILILAKYFSIRHVEMYKFRHILLSGFYALLPAILVFTKPNLGEATIFFLIWIGILIVSGIKIKHFLIILLCFSLLAVFSWHFMLRDYQRERVMSFIFPYDVLGGSWSQTQTKIAIGSGKIFGQGLAQGSQVQYGFLPEPHTDFIFSVIAEEWGVIGIFVFFTLFLVLIWRIFKIAVNSQSNFPRLFAVGFAIVLITKFTINIAMNLSLIPVVGIYLPFVSYGGSGIITNFIFLGILQSIVVRS